jgi:hypothetical protein
MKTKRFTLSEGQQEELRNCPHVKKVSARTVQFTADFKRQAIGERARGKPPRFIFSEAGIPYHFNPGYASDCIKVWKRLAQKHGLDHFDNAIKYANGLFTSLRFVTLCFFENLNRCLIFSYTK